MTGLTNREGVLGDGAIFTFQTPSLLRAAYFTHVAFSVETGEPRLSHEPSSMAEPDGKEERQQEPGNTVSFPYLQLVPHFPVLSYSHGPWTRVHLRRRDTHLYSLRPAVLTEASDNPMDLCECKVVCFIPV